MVNIVVRIPQKYNNFEQKDHKEKCITDKTYKGTLSFWSHVSSVSINTATTQLLSKAQKPMLYMFPQWKYQDKEIHKKTRPACTCPARGYCNAKSSSALIFASTRQQNNL